ncbi:sigma-70 family RNA polymerase sigma factor [Streptomyces sp. NPDC051940]|uniref:sigma-70 family RNA polymerase sigma factor n=1 Tax=Streptomyces sp. NPDC051940 TaxID=3155675 RepID=UPI00342826CA
MDELIAALRPLLTAEAAAEAYSAGVEAEDLEQALWVRVLERDGGLTEPRVWLRAAARAETRAARRRRRVEVPYRDDVQPGPDHVEDRVLEAEHRREVRRAVRAVPGQCRAVAEALLGPDDPTYREIADRLRIPQGSLGAVRSRCATYLRRALAAEG